jgi:hypothetical protein
LKTTEPFLYETTSKANFLMTVERIIYETSRANFPMTLQSQLPDDSRAYYLRNQNHLRWEPTFALPDDTPKPNPEPSPEPHPVRYQFDFG